MAGRNPNDRDFEVLQALGRLEEVVGENKKNIQDLIKVVGGDFLRNGDGLVQRMKLLEGTVRNLREEVRADLKAELQEILETELKDLKDSLALRVPARKKFKDFSGFQRISLIIAGIAASGLGLTGLFDFLSKLFATLSKLMGGP